MTSLNRTIWECDRCGRITNTEMDPRLSTQTRPEGWIGMDRDPAHDWLDLCNACSRSLTRWLMNPEPLPDSPQTEAV